MSKKTDSSVIILSAGKSSRMREHKALLQFDENNTFIQKIVKTYLQFGCRQVIVVANPDNFQSIESLNLSCKIVVNESFEKGRFSSINKGLKELLDEKYVFIQNVDNPFVNKDILDKLFFFRSENCYISPLYKNKGGHPILIPNKIYTKIQREKTQNQNLNLFLQQFCRKNVLINEPKILLNINSKEDYYKFFKIN